MKLLQPPSFFSRDWAPSVPHNGISVELPAAFASRIDRDLLMDRCTGLLAELTFLVGLTSPPECHLVAPTDSGSIVLRVNRQVRMAYVPPESMEIHHLTGWGLGLPHLEEQIVAALERLLLDDPGLLLLAGQDWAWLTTDHLLAEQQRDHDLPRRLLARGVCLPDQSVLLSTLSSADPLNPVDRLTDMHALLDDRRLLVEVAPGLLGHPGLEDLVDKIARASSLGLGVLDLPPVVRPIDDVWRGPRALFEVTNGRNPSNDCARVLLGGLPIGVLEDGSDPIELTNSLQHTAWRSVELATVSLRLDRLSLSAPRAVAALRKRMDDRQFTRILSRASAEFLVRDLPKVVDEVLACGSLEEDVVLRRLRESLVERHLGYLLNFQPLLRCISVTAKLEAELVSHASESYPPETLVLSVLESLSSLLPNVVWSVPKEVAIIVRDRESIATLRQILAAQAAQIMILHETEVPDWASGGPIGQLGSS